MTFSYKILSEPVYRQILYFHTLNRVKSGWFQKNGFTVLPKKELNDASEVVLPKLAQVDIIAAVKFMEITKRTKPILFSFVADIQSFAKLSPFPKDLFGEKLDTTQISTFIEKNFAELVYAIKFILPTEKRGIVLNIIPADFGSMGSFFFIEGKTQLDLFISTIVGGDIYFLYATFIYSLVYFALEERESAQDDSLFWSKVQFMVDFLVRQTALSYVLNKNNIKVQAFVGVARFDHLADLVKISHEYLRELDADYDLGISVTDDSLFIGSYKIYLTVAESKVMAYLLSKKGDVVTFDELGGVLWGDDDEKFSLYAISRILSDIRKKIKVAGFPNDVIYTARGRGVYLKA